MADEDYFDYEELDVGMEGDSEVLLNYFEDHTIVQEINEFLTEPVTKETVKIEIADWNEPLDVETGKVREFDPQQKILRIEIEPLDVETVKVRELEPQRKILQIETSDEVLDVDPQKKCITCKKQTTVYKQAILLPCIDENCQKMICLTCRDKSTTIRRKTICVRCGDRYLAGPRNFKQCKTCMFWRCGYCTRVFECRCLLVSELAGHSFMEKQKASRRRRHRR